MSYPAEVIPIPVEVTNQPDPNKRKYHRRAATTTTKIISATNPVVKLLDLSPRRCFAYVINYTDADIVICHAENLAVKASALADFSEQVDGTLVPKSFGSPVPLDTTDDLWVTSNSTAINAGPIRVGVLDFIYAED